ncbi:protein ABA DEFICIENT 4, chloroplastic-like isoform X1 [Salvia splendens]|uniref:protein ABA DEFICIENT 4, chloroplastic-like isoform X1 n=1 Tax=Salvia splendens TaxID=180675 RepID=UPI001C26CB6E|nr:protein ABA DEFICIENT 4, chloroplastic-like isoform X1 [Salvia splendens]
MALSSGFFTPQVCASFKVERRRVGWCNSMISQKFGPSLRIRSKKLQMFGQSCGSEVNRNNGWSFLSGRMILTPPKLGTNVCLRKASPVYASLVPCSQIASNAFTLGTAAVLPFYTLMVVAPQSEFVSILCCLGRQVYGDGLQNNIETRHSVLMCLLFCPVGILAHAITKALTSGTNETKTDEDDTISTDLIK